MTLLYLYELLMEIHDRCTAINNGEFWMPNLHKILSGEGDKEMKHEIKNLSDEEDFTEMPDAPGNTQASIGGSIGSTAFKALTASEGRNTLQHFNCDFHVQ